jgi:glycosyltransferase involved in cell wall biosynthesis
MMAVMGMQNVAQDSRVRVLTLIRDIGRGWGGAERVAFDFASRLDQKRFKSYVCITRVPHPARRAQAEADLAELQAHGVEILRLDRRSTASVVPWFALMAMLVRERIDVVHGHMPRANIPGTILGRLARVPVIVSQEHSWTSHRRQRRQFLHRNVVGRWSTVVLALSESNRRNIIESERIAPERIRVLPNAIESFPRTGHHVRRDLGIPEGTALVGAVGRLTWEKGHSDLIEAVGLLASSSSPLRCLIVGGGAEEARLERLVRESGLTEQVLLLGHRRDTRELISALDVAVLPSRSEGSPLALLEYMCAGVPIVATSVGGIPELIDDRVHGLLAPPQDPNALAARIRELLDDRELGQRLGAAAQAHQRSEFDIDVVVRRLEELYVEFIDASRGRRGEVAPVRNHAVLKSE